MMAKHGTDLWVYQDLLLLWLWGVCLFVCLPIFKSTSICFPLSSWTISSQVLGHPSVMRYGFHLVEWPFSQIRHWLVTPTDFCYLHTSIYYRQDSIVDQRLYDWVGVYISPLLMCRITSYTKDDIHLTFCLKQTQHISRWKIKLKSPPILLLSPLCQM